LLGSRVFLVRFGFAHRRGEGHWTLALRHSQRMIQYCARTPRLVLSSREIGKGSSLLLGRASSFIRESYRSYQGH
jgi:hypothetical protein